MSPRRLLVDPGENVWPSAWFGNLSHARLADVTAAPWIDREGSAPGYDFSLPPGVRPSPRGLLTLHRTFWLWPTPPALPHLGFAATPVTALWVQWRQLEPREGEYQLERLEAHIESAAAAGWGVMVRILTARVDEAPSYLEGRGVGTVHGGQSYDPADPIFHARYLTLLSAIRARRVCQRPATRIMYVGYASKSWGDEYIGPHGDDVEGEGAVADDPAARYRHVRERLDAWAGVCEGVASKVLMGGVSAHGTARGFGTRNGFVEHYWYMIPDEARGQLTSAHDVYLRVNESATLVRDGRLLLGEENEEYGSEWSSDWRTWQPGARGGPFNASAPPQGGAARYGPLASFPYRYLLSSLRILQMRVNTLLASTTVVHPSLFAYIALELARTAEDAPDAWAFLGCTHLLGGRLGGWRPVAAGGDEVCNFERWLHQRSAPAAAGRGVVSLPDGKLTQTPAPPSNRSWLSLYHHDTIAQHAPAGRLGFRLDRRWASRARPLPELSIKVTLFDVAAGTVRIVQRQHAGAAGRRADGAAAPRSSLRQIGGTLATTGDGALKTLTFLSPRRGAGEGPPGMGDDGLRFDGAVGGGAAAEEEGSEGADGTVAGDGGAGDSGAASTVPLSPFDSFDFEVLAEEAPDGPPIALVVSMVRVIRGPNGRPNGRGDAVRASEPTGGAAFNALLSAALVLAVAAAMFAAIREALSRSRTRVTLFVRPHIAAPPGGHAGRVRVAAHDSTLSIASHSSSTRQQLPSAGAIPRRVPMPRIF